MATWTLQDIREKARRLSGRLSISELSNTEVDEYINRYLQYEFPAEVKLNKNLTTVQVTTTANTKDYNFPSGYTNFVPEAKIDNYHLSFYQDPAIFENENPLNVTRNTSFTGDGSTTAFSTTLSLGGFPIEAGSVLIDDQTEVGVDDGSGNLVSDVTNANAGTINYTTGAISYTFNAAPSSGQSIYVSFVRMPKGRPYSVLMFDSKFSLYPVPDRAYRLTLKAWELNLVVDSAGAEQISFEDATDRPRLDEWGPAIAFGAARRISEDYGEFDKYQQLSALYQEQLDYILTRTLIDLESARALPRF